MKEGEEGCKNHFDTNVIRLVASCIDDDGFPSKEGGAGSILTQYLINSGRSGSGATAVSQKIDFHGLDFNFIIKLTGQVNDADSVPGAGVMTHSISNEKVVQSVFGVGGRDGLVNGAMPAQTLVSDANDAKFGKFDINCMVSLRNINSRTNVPGEINAMSVSANTGLLAPPTLLPTPVLTPSNVNASYTHDVAGI